MFRGEESGREKGEGKEVKDKGVVVLFHFFGVFIFSVFWVHDKHLLQKKKGLKFFSNEFFSFLLVRGIHYFFELI